MKAVQPSSKTQHKHTTCMEDNNQGHTLCTAVFTQGSFTRVATIYSLLHCAAPRCTSRTLCFSVRQPAHSRIVHPSTTTVHEQLHDTAYHSDVTFAGVLLAVAPQPACDVGAYVVGACRLQCYCIPPFMQRYNKGPKLSSVYTPTVLLHIHIPIYNSIAHPSY